MTFEQLLSVLHFEPAVEAALRRKYAKDEKTLRLIAETAYSGEDFRFALCKRKPFTRLAVTVLLLADRFNTYKALGALDEIIFDTFRDVSLRANLYHAKTGMPGLTTDDVIWFRHIMNAAIFKIGTLQFQPFDMLYLDESTIGEPYMTFSSRQKMELPHGTPVLNCHIQHGADLSPVAVSRSFESAITFFQERFPLVRYRAFLCYSWLLYPPMLAHLSDKSNIKRFAEHFQIISTCNDPTQALENISEGNATSLQQLAAKHKECLGYGCGIIPL